ncbi:hypothetical protein OS493_032586 [Desmophyllum pertusum]|uniref:Uncharacterized protein n=1 Tax=Desmophyllum pertusum TaxID=174260 RepID=A0A9X0CII3_9CNID|nr:hypothetical protein OS493_032586 [Desmophyllum pertusum]
MKDEAVKSIRSSTGDKNYGAKDIQWVLTVPAIWTPAAKQFMREAAYKAGIASPDNKDQLIIALEPEGAAIFCRERKMEDFADQTGDACIYDVVYRPGLRYLMMDIGGGTLDVTAHDILADGTITEIYQVTGGAYGGIYVDENFVSLLENLFGIPTVKEFRLKYPADWLRMMNDFEMKKRGRRAFDDKATRIVLPRKFIEMIDSIKDLTKRLKKSCNLHDVEILNNEYLCLGPKTMKKLFDPVVNGIVSHMKGLFDRPALKNVSCLFMVGGFAESVILQEAIKTALIPTCNVLTPNYAGIAVVQGATMFGQKPNIIKSRIMATTYGFAVHRKFNPEIHDPSKKHIAEYGALCKDIFDVIVKEGDSVKVGERKRSIRHPLHSDGTSVSYAFYTSTDPNVKYITDSTVDHL